jgi:hypothetical protein
MKIIIEFDGAQFGGGKIMALLKNVPTEHSKGYEYGLFAPIVRAFQQYLRICRGIYVMCVKKVFYETKGG